MGVSRCKEEAAALRRFTDALRGVLGLDPIYGQPQQRHEVNSVPTFWRQSQELRHTDPGIALSSEGWFARQKARDPERALRAAQARHPVEP